MAKQDPDADNPPPDPAVADAPVEGASPAAAAAITRLLAEIDRLRDELAQNNARIQDLESRAGRDPLAPAAAGSAKTRHVLVKKPRQEHDPQGGTGDER